MDNSSLDVVNLVSSTDNKADNNTVSVELFQNQAVSNFVGDLLGKARERKEITENLFPKKKLKIMYEVGIIAFNFHKKLAIFQNDVRKS